MTTYSESRWKVCLLKDKDGNVIWEKIIIKPKGSDWRKKLKRLQDRHHQEAKTLRELEETSVKLANLVLEEPEEIRHYCLQLPDGINRCNGECVEWHKEKEEKEARQTKPLYTARQQTKGTGYIPGIGNIN